MQDGRKIGLVFRIFRPKTLRNTRRSADKQRAQEADPVSQAVVAELTESEARAYAIPVRPIPREDMWFENVWRDFREGAVFQ